MPNTEPKMTIYIHGFGSSGQGGKASLFREYYQSINAPFIAPSLSYIPDLAISTLEELINSYLQIGTKVTLIGSSLGGYYALYLAEKYQLKAILINPAVASSKTLKKAIDMGGTAKNYYDNSTFTWQESYIEMLKKFQTPSINSKNYFLLLQKGDDVLDYKEALNKLPQAKTILEENGTHSFENIERFFEEIRGF